MTAPNVGFDLIARDQAGAIVAGLREKVQGLGAVSATAGRQGAREFSGFRGMLVSMGASAEGASKGSRLLEGAFVGLAVRGAGVGGVMGKIASGALLLGGGSGLLVGVAAAAAIAGLAWQASTRTADEHTAAITRMVEQYKRLPSAADDVVTLRRSVEGLAQALRDVPKPPGPGEDPMARMSFTDFLKKELINPWRTMFGMDELPTDYQEAGQATSAARTAGRRAASAAGQTPDQMAKRFRSKGGPAEASLDAKLMADAERKAPKDTGAADAKADFFSSGAAAANQAWVKEAEGAKLAVREQAAATREASRRITESAIAMSFAVANVVSAIIRGDSAGSILGGIGGVVSLIPGGQLIGAGLMVGGGILDAATSNRPVPVSVTNAGDIASAMRATGPQRVTIVLTDSRGNILTSETQYALQRQSATDGVVRLPVGVRHG